MTPYFSPPVIHCRVEGLKGRCEGCIDLPICTHDPTASLHLGIGFHAPARSTSELGTNQLQVSGANLHYDLARVDELLCSGAQTHFKETCKGLRQGAADVSHSGHNEAAGIRAHLPQELRPHRVHLMGDLTQLALLLDVVPNGLFHLSYAATIPSLLGIAHHLSDLLRRGPGWDLRLRLWLWLGNGEDGPRLWHLTGIKQQSRIATRLARADRNDHLGLD
jgi:hypothetical protein